MPNEGFLQRWSRLKADPLAAELPAAPVAPIAPIPAEPSAEASAAPAALPTLEDAAGLDSQSDFSPFVARDVDSAVRRLAMKKLFADPHFNLIDGLDIYMGDYNVPDPVSPAMLASLVHSFNSLPRRDEPAAAAAAQAAPPVTDQPAAALPATDPPAAGAPAAGSPAAPSTNQEAA